MTIRNAILRGLLALVLLAIFLSGTLSYLELRRSLQQDIAQNLGNSAQGLLERVDVYMFERLEDLREWHRLEILQDIQVGDVDKRLARLLSDLKAGHGDVYENLYCTNLEGRIVAASDPGLTGRIKLPGAASSQTLQGGDESIVMEKATTSAPEDNSRFVLRAPVANAFGSGNLGYFYAVLNWSVVQRFMQEGMSGSERTALLLDSQDRVIAAVGPLSPSPQALPIKLPPWYDDTGNPVIGKHSGTVLGADTLLVGAASSAGLKHFQGNGWHMLVVVPTRVAFAPVVQLGWAMFAGLVLSMLIAGWLAVRLSDRIARPIGQLTQFARSYRRNNAQAIPSVESGISEVAELSHAFNKMIRDLERSQENLVRASKLAVVGEMAAAMAHEVRTPLGILKSSAQMLERRPGLSEQDRELTGYILSEAERLNGLISTLLESTSPRPPFFQRHDLHEIITHVLALLEGKLQSGGLHIEQQLEASPSVISCDREQMIQVMLNLVINAIQHVPAGGRIRLSTRTDGNGLRIQIEDNGPGIAEQDRARVFDPFFTKRKGGFGLGLTIVQQIIQSHGGRIEVTASQLGGACFAIDLPQTGEKEERA